MPGPVLPPDEGGGALPPATPPPAAAPAPPPPTPTYDVPRTSEPNPAGPVGGGNRPVTQPPQLPPVTVISPPILQPGTVYLPPDTTGGGYVVLPPAAPGDSGPPVPPPPGDDDDLDAILRFLKDYAPDVSGQPGWELADPFDARQLAGSNPPLKGGGAVRVIVQKCADYGVDGIAAIADALHEGAGGGIGDDGIAYGPFQIHATDGRLPQFNGKPRNSRAVNAWAWTENGLEYGVRSMVNGHPSAKGLTGHRAVAAIVYGFERPADERGAYKTRAAEYDHLVALGSGWPDYAAARFAGPAGGGATDPGLGNPPASSPYTPAGVNTQWRGMLGFLATDLGAISGNAGAFGDRLLQVFK